MILFVTNLTLRDIQGEGVSTFSPKQKQYSLVNGMDAARASSSKEDAK